MLRRSELTKERVEPTILSITAIEITYLTRFALILLLRIQSYMWRNHVATCVWANNNGRNSDVITIRFTYLQYILQHCFWIGFKSE